MRIQVGVTKFVMKADFANLFYCEREMKRCDIDTSDRNACMVFLCADLSDSYFRANYFH